MTKIIDSTNLGYLISKMKSAFWPKSDVVQIGLDNSPTSGGLDIAIHVLDIESNNKINLIYDYLMQKYDEKYIQELNSKVLDIINQVVNNDDIYINDIKVKEFETLSLN